MPGFNIGAAMNNLFGGKPAGTGQPPANPNAQPKNQREQQQNVARGQAPTGENTQLENAGGNVDGSTDDPNNKEPANPLDKYKDIWQPPKDAEGKVVKQKEKTKFSIDPAKMMEFAGKQDFKKFVKPETVAAIQKGGEEGSAAFLQAIQDIGSSTFATSMTAASQLMEKAIESARADWDAELPERFKRFSAKDNLRTKNPALNHPAAQPIIDALQSRLAQAYPDATTAEHQEMAVDFLTSFAASIGKKSGEEEDGDTTSSRRSGSKKAKEEDWGVFLDQ